MTNSVIKPNFVASAKELELINAYWRAANYLTVAQIYLQDNPLLERELRIEDIKPRLLGHWGTSPGLNLIYAHLNYLISKSQANVIYLTGPGHGGPAIVANVYLEGTYSKYFPEITQDREGLKRLVRQFSTPGGISSHVGPSTPGSIHEGGELGYVLLHAFGAVFDNPDLIAVAVIGDGEAETAALEGSWKSIKFLNPARDGAVLPILHLNGYKISGPTVLARTPRSQLVALLNGHGYCPIFVDCEEQTILQTHINFNSSLALAYQKITEIQSAARAARDTSQLWPVIVLVSPKGWTGPKEVDHKKVEGSFRSHQVPLAKVRSDPAQLIQLEHWLKSYAANEIFDQDGKLIPEVHQIIPKSTLRMGDNPHANGGALSQALNLPDISSYQIQVNKPGKIKSESTAQLGKYLRDIFKLNSDQNNFRLFCPDETNSNRLSAVFEATQRCSNALIRDDDESVARDGRVMEVLSEHCCHGWLEGYTLTGRHGLFASYEAFAVIVDSMAMQHFKWLEHSAKYKWRKPVPSLNYLLTSTCWRNDHNGFSHQGPGFIDNLVSKNGDVVRVYLPIDANTLLATAEHIFQTKNYLNLIVIDKQPQLQWLNLDQAKEHCRQGASILDFCSDDCLEPDIVMACAGDIATQETVAAVCELRKFIPALKIRVVNVIDLMVLCPKDKHPHALSSDRFSQLFTCTKDVVFAFHGYAGVIHQLIHGRPDCDRFHVRGYREQGTTTTPFDMLVLNQISRYDLALLAAKYAKADQLLIAEIQSYRDQMIAEHNKYITQYFEDLKTIKDWTYASL